MYLMEKQYNLCIVNGVYALYNDTCMPECMIPKDLVQFDLMCHPADKSQLYVIMPGSSSDVYRGSIIVKAADAEDFPTADLNCMKIEEYHYSSSALCTMKQFQNGKPVTLVPGTEKSNEEAADPYPVAFTNLISATYFIDHQARLGQFYQWTRTTVFSDGETAIGIVNTTTGVFTVLALGSDTRVPMTLIETDTEHEFSGMTNADKLAFTKRLIGAVVEPIELRAPADEEEGGVISNV